MGRMPAVLALVAMGFAGCDSDDDVVDEGKTITIHVANQSAEPVWVGGECAGYYSSYDKVFSGTVNPGQVGSFTVDYWAGSTMRVRVFRVSDGFVLFEAV